MRAIFLILFTNLILLDSFIVFNFLQNNQAQTSKAAITSIYKSPSQSTSSESLNPPADCDEDCRVKIAEKVLDSLNLTPTTKPAAERVVIQTSHPTSPPITQSQSTNNAQEFFIPFGTGSTSATEWTDVPGVKAQVDSTKYSNVKQILFEASTHVANNANQIIEVRLYNETDRYVIGNSEFLYPSGTSENFRIASIQLGSGAKTYQVQMKTQLGYSAFLDQARIHITTN